MAVTAVQNEDGTFAFSGRSLKPTQDKNAALEAYGKQVYDYGQVLVLLPDRKQEQKIRQFIGNARFVRNRYLNDRIEQYKKDKSTLTVNDYCKNVLPKLKEEYPFLLESDKFSLEAALQHVDDAYKNFFSGRTKFPRFASKWKPNGNRYMTKYTNNNLDLVVGKDGLPYLKLPKIGLVRVVLPFGKTVDSILPPGTRILNAVISKCSTGRFEASLCLETVIDRIQPVMVIQESDVLGLDMGLKEFCVAGDMESFVPVANPRWIRLHERRLRRLQKSLSRKQYDKETHTGSKNYEKVRAAVARQHRKIACQRKDFHHKLSRAITDACTASVCEDLNIKGMMKNRHLSKAIASVGWAQFLTFLKYKMERAGKHYIEVSRWYASSQTCSVCGYRNPDTRDLKVREWDCPECGTHHDRDGNAARNLAMEGISFLKEKGVSILPAAR